MTPRTPGPATPGDSSTSYNNISTPSSSNIISNSSTNLFDWFTLKDVVVRTKTDNAEGILKDYNHSEGTCRVEFNKKEVSISPENLEPVQPNSKKDTIIILAGEFKGRTGSLFGTDTENEEGRVEAYVKIHPTYEVKILDIQILAKYHQTS